MDLSIVVTVYNHKDIVSDLVQAIADQVRERDLRFEIILVDDCSQDGSADVIEKLAEQLDFVKGIVLFSNAGQHRAMTAGIDAASGDQVLIMDGDFENPVTAIIPLYEKITTEDLDIVCAVANNRQSLSREITSALFYFTLKNVFRVDIIRNQLMMRIMTGEFVRKFRRYNERVRTIAGLTTTIGGRTGTVETTLGKRHSGTSNYNFLSRADLYLDVILGLTSNPLKALLYAGLATLVATGLASIFYLYRYFDTGVLPGFTTLILSIFFFGSANMISIALVARYLAIIYTEVRERPMYLVRDKYNFPETS